MHGPKQDTLAEIDPELLDLKTIEISKRHEALKGLLTTQFPPLFILECHSWEEFIQMLEPVYRYPIAGNSPTMPITIDIKKPTNDKEELVGTFTALSGLTYPTLLIYSHNMTPEEINEKKEFLEECGYIVIVGKLSFFKGEQ